MRRPWRNLFFDMLLSSSWTGRIERERPRTRTNGEERFAKVTAHRRSPLKSVAHLEKLSKLLNSDRQCRPGNRPVAQASPVKST